MRRVTWLRNSTQGLVKEFHTIFGRPTRTKLTQLSVAERDLRLRLIHEEFAELVFASGFEAPQRDGLDFDDATLCHVEASQQDSVEMADGLGDIVVVCYGMAQHMGIDLDLVIREIHRSNMSKAGSNGKPIINGESPEGVNDHGDRIDLTRPAGKILKGPHYFRPDIAGVLGLSCEDEGCPHFGTQHAHPESTK